jgi:hypothetical protein
MRLLNIINPVTVYRKAALCVKDVANYRFYRKSVSDLNRSGLLKEKGMRTDWLRRVYFVINLLPETLLAGTDIELLERSRVMEAIAERNQIFTKDGLLEIVQADYRRIKDSDFYAYLIWIKYRSLSKFSDWAHVLIWLAAVSLIAVNYQILIDLSKYIGNLYYQINN